MPEQVITLQYALNPTKHQIEQLSSQTGAVRYAYNYALNKVLTNWQDVKTGVETEYINTSAYALRKMFNQEKDEIAPWCRHDERKRS